MDISSISNTMGAGLNATQEPASPRPLPDDQRTLIQAVRAVNAAEMFGPDNELTFILDRNSRRTVVRIINRETREVVDQIPAEYILRMAEELKRT